MVSDHPCAVAASSHSAWLPTRAPPLSSVQNPDVRASNPFADLQSSAPVAAAVLAAQAAQEPGAVAVSPVRRVDPTACLPHVVWAMQSSVPVAAQPVVQSAQALLVPVRRVDPSSWLPHVVAEGGQAFVQNVLKPPFEHAAASSAELPTTVFNPVANRRLAKARVRAGMVGNTESTTKKTPDSPGFPGPALYAKINARNIF